MKKVLGVLIAITLFVSSLSVAVFGVNNVGVYESDDNDGSTIALHLTDENGNNVNSNTGQYTIGTDFYFRINVYVTSNLKGDNVVRKINFMDENENDDNNATNFMYSENSGTSWNADEYLGNYDCYKFRGSKEDRNPVYKYTQSGPHTTLFKVRFNKTGRHIIEYSVTCFDESYRLIQRKYIDINKDGTFRISSYAETNQTTTQPPTTTTAPRPTYTVLIDGVPYQSDIEEGGTCVLPSSGYGFLDRRTNKLYRAYFQLSDIHANYNLSSVDQVNVSCAKGANIKTDGRHGIRFGSIVTIKNLNGKDITSIVLKSGAIQIGTIITPYDCYTDLFEGNIDKEYVDEVDPDKEFHFDVLNPKDDWPKNTENNTPNYGLCYAGIVNVTEGNLKRNFISSAYVRIEYQTYGEDPYIDYRNATNQNETKRSIRGVALKMKAAGYPGCTPAEIAILEYYCSL